MHIAIGCHECFTWAGGWGETSYVLAGFDEKWQRSSRKGKGSRRVARLHGEKVGRVHVPFPLLGFFARIDPCLIKLIFIFSILLFKIQS